MISDVSLNAEEKTQYEKDGEVTSDKEMVLTKEELITCMSANLFLLFLGGFDTTSMGKVIWFLFFF